MGLFSKLGGGSNSNHTCPTLSLAETTTDPITGTYTFHTLNLIISGAATAFSVLSIFILMTNHAMHLSRPKEQLKIMRISLLIPIYGILCFISVAVPQAYVYLLPWMDVAQAMALGNFFLLMCQLISPDDNRRDTFFAALQVPQKKSRKGGSSIPQDGLTWYRRLWFMIFQYTPVSLIVAILTCIFQAANKYCLTSSKPYFAHLWLNLIHIISLSLAVSSVLRFYGVLKKELAGHKPLAKLLAFKLLVGLNFLLQIIFWILNDIKPSPLAPSKTLSYSDVTAGIPLLVNCLLMVPFSVFFHYAYDVRPYRLSNMVDQELQPMNAAALPPRYHGGPLGIKAWIQVWNPMEIVDAILFSFKMFSESRKMSSSKQNAVDSDYVQGSDHLGQDTAYEGGMPGYSNNAGGQGHGAYGDPEYPQNAGAPVHGGRY